MLDTVYNISNKKIGYFVFNSFLGDTTQVYNKFSSLFSRFATENIADLIVDLRYNGGDATVRSFLGNHPLRRAFLNRMPSSQEQEEARQFILSRYPTILPTLSSLPLYIELPADPRTGAPAALLVHAGIRPGIPLQEQNPQDLLWIREPFYLYYDGELPVIFGHTPVPGLPQYTGSGPWRRDNIVGIDGGAGYWRGVMLVEWPSLQSIFVPIRDRQSSPQVRVY